MAEKKYIVSTSDKMITLRNPPTEYEHSGPKTLPLTDNCIFAASGLALQSLPIFESISNQLKEPHTINNVANIGTSVFVQNRTNVINQTFLNKFGLSLNQFLRTQRILDPTTVQRINDGLNSYKYDLSLIIAGVDELGPHIYSIEDPGSLSLHDSLGHCSIGSGNVQSFSTFISNEYHSDMKLHEVVSIVFDAKKKSEEATGVGEKSDIYITSKYSVKKLSSDNVSLLEKNHLETKSLYKSLKKEQQIKIDNMDFQL